MAFVTLTKEQFEAALPEGYQVVDVPRTWEVVYQIHTGWRKVDVRIYSTVDKRTGVTRDKGEDAIRIVYWDVPWDRPIGKGKKILRVEGATTIPERIKQRVEEFIRDVKKQNIVDFDYVKAILSSPAVGWSSFATSLLEQLEARGSLSDNQLAYVLGEMNPKGKRTFESVVKAEDPGFAERYVAEGEVDNGKGTAEEGQTASHYPEEKRLGSGRTGTRKEGGTDKEGHGRRDGHGVPLRGAGENDDTPPWEEPNMSLVRSGSQSGVQAWVDERPRHDLREDHDGGVIQEGSSEVSTTRLIPTAEYPDWKYPFPAFNPVQSEALSFREKDINFVVSAATSCGKTVVAEFFIDHVLQNGV